MHANTRGGDILVAGHRLVKALTVGSRRVLGLGRRPRGWLPVPVLRSRLPNRTLPGAVRRAKTSANRGQILLQQLTAMPPMIRGYFCVTWGNRGGLHQTSQTLGVLRSFSFRKFVHLSLKYCRARGKTMPIKMGTSHAQGA